MRLDAVGTSDLVGVVGFARIVVGLTVIGMLAWWFNRRARRGGGR
jgi:hypothetical protein